jgi:hypothetical protein
MLGNRGRAREPRLRIPAALAFAILGCNGKSPVADAPIDGDGTCQVFCYPNGTDAGVCPSNPYQCVSANRMCPAGCDCTTFCFPRTPEGEQNCPTTMGVQCAAPDRTCPAGCEPVG